MILVLDEAETSYKRAIALKPNFGEAKHMLAALTGVTTLTAPRDYVEGMFDIYATKFEGILVDMAIKSRSHSKNLSG